LVCLAVFLGGCGGKEPPLSKEAQTLKKELLGEIDKLTAALVEPVGKQDWETVKPILQTSYEEMEKRGKIVPAKVVAMDQNGIIQANYPHRDISDFDFYNYGPAKIVYIKKMKAQAMLYFGKTKIYILMSPLLKRDQVIGAVAMSFLEEELQNKWKVSEKEFLSIDFNG